MKNFFKNNLKIFVLAIMVIAMGTLVFTSNALKTSTKTSKVASDESKSGYNYNNNYYDDEYDYDDEDEYEYSYSDEDGNNYYNYYYYGYNNENYKNTNNKKYTSLPTVKYSTSTTLDLFQDFDPYKYVETEGKVTVIYNDVDNTKVGNYSVQYSVCNNYSNSACRYIYMSVLVRDFKKSYTKYEEYDSTNASSVRWSNIETKKCRVGDNSCSTYNVSLPTATDPYTNRNVDVTVSSSNVNVNKTGIYYIIYQATSSAGVTSTKTRQVQIYDGNNSNNVSYDYRAIRTKEIKEHKWQNVVTYQYQCVNPNVDGANAWKYTATLTNDDHSTYYYDVNGYKGILNKVSFYEVNPYNGDLREKLGKCNKSGELRTLTRTFVGLYSGTVTNYGNY